MAFSFRGFLSSLTGGASEVFNALRLIGSSTINLGPLSDGDYPVSYQGALTISALYRARNVITGAMAATEFRLEEITPQGLKPVEGNPIDNALRFGLDADMEQAVFLDALISHAAFKGNGYAALSFDDNGEFENATLLDPDWVKPANAPNGEPGYWVREPNQEPYWLDQYEVLHLMGPSHDGRQGLSWIDLAKRSLNLAINTERYGGRFFSKGYIFSGILNVPGAIKKETEEELKINLRRMHEGASNSHGILMLKGEQKYTPNTAINPQDAQFLATRAFNVYEIARWTGVPPSKLYVEGGVTYNGSEQEELDFRSNCLLFWVNRFKQQVAKKLIPLDKRSRWVVTHNFRQLNGIDRLTAIRAESLAVNWGMRLPNESRRELGFGLDLPGGDTPMRPGNMQPIGSQPGTMPGDGGPVPLVDQVPALPDVQAPDAATAAATGDVQATALNGAQVTSLKEIVADVQAGILSVETGAALVAVAFPLINQAEIDKIFAGIKAIPKQPSPEPTP